MPILPTSCSSATAASSAIACGVEPEARADGDGEVVDGVGVLAGVAVARLERRGERLDDGPHRLGRAAALALEVAQHRDERVVALGQATRSRQRLLAQLQGVTGLTSGITRGYRPR